MHPSGPSVTNPRGKHERIGRHEAPEPAFIIEFESELTDAELKAFKREWQRQFSKGRRLWGKS